MKLKYRVIERFRGKYSIQAMCAVFEVSRSGYYAWRNRQEKSAKDQWLVDLIVECQKRSKQTYGIRRVRRWIQRHTGKVVNIKGRSAGHAQAEPAVRGSPPQAIYPLP